MACSYLGIFGGIYLICIARYNCVGSEPTTTLLDYYKITLVWKILTVERSLICGWIKEEAFVMLDLILIFLSFPQTGAV